MTVFYDTAENLHPFECNGRGKCRHCDRSATPDHDPATCALCDPAYDGGDPYTAPAEDGDSHRLETETSNAS